MFRFTQRIGKVSEKKMKRGFETKKATLEWEREFLEVKS